MTWLRIRVARSKQVTIEWARPPRVACFARERLRTPRCAARRRPPFHFNQHSACVALDAGTFDYQEEM
jgi:hypothetical protein